MGRIRPSARLKYGTVQVWGAFVVMSRRSKRELSLRSSMLMKLKRRIEVLIGCLALTTAIAGRARGAGYVQTNLVTDGSDPAVTAPTIDPHLINPWGISFFPGM